jgi:ribosomal-protein-alanine N-acetyltransferase
MAACYFNNPSGEIGYITSFSVTKPYLRKGIATKMLNRIIDYAKAKGYNSISLNVNKLNDVAVEFYMKSGFQIVGAINDSGYIPMRYLIKN